LVLIFLFLFHFLWFGLLSVPVVCETAVLSPLIVIESSHSFRIVQQSTCFNDSSPICKVHSERDGQEQQPLLQPLPLGLIRNSSISDSHFISSYLFQISVDHRRDSIVECQTAGNIFKRFRMPPIAGDVKFLIYSDAQWDMKVFQRLLSMGRAAQPVAIVYGGDATQNAKPHQWMQFLRSIQSSNNTAPLILARGNHDFESLSPFNRVVFGATRVSSMNLGNACLVVIDADWVLRELAWMEPSADASVAFFAELDAALQSTSWRNALFRIVVCHVPTTIEWWDPVAWFGRGEQREPRDITRLLWPRWRDAGVDIIVGGHSHMYSHRVLEPYGVHEFIVGGAGGSLENRRVTNVSTALVEHLVYHYVEVEVHGCNLRWQARDENNNSLETVNLASHRCVP
jgi:predicted phosphodiesterase